MKDLEYSCSSLAFRKARLSMHCVNIGSVAGIGIIAVCSQCINQDIHELFSCPVSVPVGIGGQTMKIFCPYICCIAARFDYECCSDIALSIDSILFPCKNHFRIMGTIVIGAEILSVICSQGIFPACRSPCHNIFCSCPILLYLCKLWHSDRLLPVASSMQPDQPEDMKIWVLPACLLYRAARILHS